MRFLTSLATAAIGLLAIMSSVTQARPTARRLTTNSTLVQGRHFNRVIIIMLENKDFIAAAKQPYFASLGKRGRVMTHYAGLTHPSQPNYIGTIFGSLNGTNMSFDVDLPYTNIVDLLETKDVSWKAYMEKYPGNCFTGSKTKDLLYRRKHNPFISANNIRENPKRCARIVEGDQFQTDLDAGKLPQFSFYTPDMNNDGHDTSLDYAADWLKGFLEPKMARADFLDGETLVVVTFDENDYILKDNLVWTGLIGSGVKADELDDTPYSHYDLLRTIEDNWDLGTLGRMDADVPGFQNLYPINA
ncbi:phosphoesterase family-domain-containing protein [Syncephalis fuscata]|nr:phosphoesterase family-domain-containing protein [Syncephalis fuscata]